MENIIKEAEKEIVSILEPQNESMSKKRENTLPPGFGLKEKVFTLIFEKGQGGRVTKEDIKNEIQHIHQITINDDQAQGALSNLKSDGKIEIVGRGVYTLKNA